MESLVNYGSDDESGDYNDYGKNNYQSRQRLEEDTNYDEIGMDESSEESNNNHAEGHFSRDKPESSKSDNNKGSTDAPPGHIHIRSSFQLERETNHKSEDNSTQNEFCHDKRRRDCWDDIEIQESKKGSLSKQNEEILRRHSSDMEVDDGEDDLDNYISGDSKFTDTTQDYRQKFFQKNINFTKGKNLGEEPQKIYQKTYHLTTAHSNINEKNSEKPKRFSESKSAEGENSFEESQRNREERLRRDKGKDFEDRKKEEFGKKDDRDNRRRDEDKWKDSDRDRRRESDKCKDVKDRRKSPDRREHNKKRSHSPDKRDRDRDFDRDRDRCRSRERERERDRDRDRDRDRSRERLREKDRDRDRERDRDRDRERDCDRDRDRERDKDRDRDRDREYCRDRDRRSPKHSRRSSGSPERSWKARKLEKKAAVLNKLGIELKTDVTGNLTPRQLLGEQLKAQIQEVEAKTGVTLPTYYNPGVMNPLKYAQQIQKRKLLWGNKNNETKTNESAGQSSSVPSTVKQWEAATFKGDNDGKMTEKFKRLMGIKGDAAGGSVTSSASKPPETKEIIQKQEEMFSNMEAQYQVARMATHTHRGVGLGFGTFQVPPR